MRRSYIIPQVARLFALLIIATLLYAKPSGAVSLSALDAQVDAIFSQPSFGDTPIDARFRSWRFLPNPDPALRAPSSQAEVNGVFYSQDIFSDSINFFAVDEVTFCGQPGARFLGCALIGYSGVIVEYDYLSGPLGAVLAAHEISHNLGLRHTASGLMREQLSADVSLTADEVSVIRSSSFIQEDADGFFVDIIPYLLVSPTAVPLPPSGMLSLAGLAGFAMLARRRSRRRGQPAVC